MWVALLKEKSKALEQFKKFKSIVEAEKEVKIKCVREVIKEENFPLRN